MGGGLLKGVLRLYVQLTSHLVSVVTGEIIIQRLAVATNASSYGCGVGREDGSHEWHLPFGVQKPHAGGPLIKMGQDILMAHTLVRAYALDDSSGSKRERASFVIVTIGIQGIHAEARPHFTIIIIL